MPKEPALEEDHLAKTVAALERVAGRRPTGTRSSHSAALLRQYGYIYRSEGSADQRPHYEFDEGGGNGLVNLPMHYVIDDAMYFNFNWLGSDPSAQRITDPERVCDIWWAAFRQQYNAGGYLNVCMHPFQSGRARSRPAPLATRSPAAGPKAWRLACEVRLAPIPHPSDRLHSAVRRAHTSVE